MRKILLAFVLVSSACLVNAQTKDPVKWTFSSKKGNGDYEVHLVATIEKGWHIYSQTTPSGGPIPTKIEFTSSPLITFQGKTKEDGKLEQHNEPLFGVDVKQFSNQVKFVQTVKLKAQVKTTVNGSVEYMVCNDRECLPPKTVPFSVALMK